jgi:myo-inositol-1(or 4)-monophosphatase
MRDRDSHQPSAIAEHRFLIDTILSAGGIALDHFRRADRAFEEKSSSVDLVTIADREVEEFIAAAIRSAFRGDDLLAEESAAERVQALSDAGQPLPPRLWVVDPIDGTTNFVHSFPIFGVSVAFWREGKPEAAAVFNPAMDELFAAIRGGGATLNGRPLRVSRQADVNKALLATGYAYDRRQRPDYYMALTKAILMNAHGVRRLGSAALDLCWVAAGRLDGYVETGLKPWDVAAGRLIVEEAGGQVTDFFGAPLGLDASEVIASNGAIHDGLVDIFQDYSGGQIPEGD